MTIDELGPRICIMGPSNSGKSTLAAAIGRARDLVPIYLDQLYYQPNAQWQPRPEAEFIALHANAIANPRWVIDGNYSRCLPQRLERATGLILLDVPTATSLRRYLRRCFFEPQRQGAVEGSRDRVAWSMIRHITVATRRNRRRYKQLFAELDLPKVALRSTREVSRFYESGGLTR